jgi:REP-associated tyrosine transposase
MSKPPRDYTSFGTGVYFVTASTWGHRSLFQTERMGSLFIDTIFHYRHEQKFLIHEFVVMPDHIHLLLAPIGIALERAMQLVKGGYSYRVKKELGLGMEIWERGYVDHRIRDALDYARHVAYIRQNPVEAHLANCAQGFSLCSAYPGFDLDACPQGLKPLLPRDA